MGRILVTGFEAFQGEKLNPSRLIVEHLRRARKDADLLTAVLPVSFQRAFPALREAAVSWRDLAGVLMFGQAGGRDKLSLERVALNWIETSSPDEDHVLPLRAKIDESGPDALFSPLPLEHWKKSLEEKGVPTEVSLSAGGFVCNQVYYQAAAALRPARVPALFVHVPYLPEQARAGQASMPLETMLTAADFLLGAFRDQ
ncbi:MAG: pyroglutamyl-peptidase I [Bdellovibrionaceae bacterium]|nr:pyroglutamyl-peptidase I [Pseudobdellovibrionaceae bacterium]MBX3033154.1 pyroglutamyl-peptidase I [Pseudobdellovibrionaceae bacterium]